MIDSVYLGPVRLDNDKRFLRSIKNLAYPNVNYSTVVKGGYEGQAITPSKFSGYRIQTEWVVGGTSFSDLATEREDFARLLGQIISQGNQTLYINKANGTDVQVDVSTADILSDVSDPDPLNSPMMIEMQAEYPFLQSQILTEEDVFIFSGGGMPIPTPIPMPMNIGGTNEVILTNNGTYQAFPIIRFYGPLETPTLTNVTTGKTMNLNLTLASGSDIVEVDTYLRTAKFLPSESNARRYVSGDFFTIDIGQNIIHLGSADPNIYGKVTISYRDAFLGI